MRAIGDAVLSSPSGGEKTLLDLERWESDAVVAGRGTVGIAVEYPG